MVDNCSRNIANNGADCAFADSEKFRDRVICIPMGYMVNEDSKAKLRGYCRLKVCLFLLNVRV